MSLAVTASTVVPYQYTMIVWAVAFGYIVFGDVPSLSTVIGAVVIIGAGFYIFLREREIVEPQTDTARLRQRSKRRARERRAVPGSRQLRD